MTSVTKMNGIAKQFIPMALDKGIPESKRPFEIWGYAATLCCQPDWLVSIVQWAPLRM